VGANGEKAWTEVLPAIVRATLLPLLSTKRFDWQINKDVPEIAVNGAVGGVNAAV
jgi:hypothetical protein